MNGEPAIHPAFATPELRVATTIAVFTAFTLAATLVALAVTGIVNLADPARYDKEPLQQRQQIG